MIVFVLLLKSMLRHSANIKDNNEYIILLHERISRSLLGKVSFFQVWEERRAEIKISAELFAWIRMIAWFSELQYSKILGIFFSYLYLLLHFLLILILLHKDILKLHLNRLRYLMTLLQIILSFSNIFQFFPLERLIRI